MLWKKESRRSDALYVDAFKPNTQHWDSILHSHLQTIDQKPHPEKSDAIALEKRNMGNDLFRDSSPVEALVFYGDCLRFAKPGSEHISLAYANRSACFLSLKMYDECLVDIENAMSAGYPERLRPKLNDRKAKCLKEMQEDSQYPHEKSTIEPDEKFPCMSNMIKVQRNGDKDDYSVVAKVDIDIGQVIVTEDVQHTYVTQCFGLYCNICAKGFCNLVPCEKCAVAMFCSECQGHSLHEYECGLNFCGESEFNCGIMHLVRDILLTLKMFATADELMLFVEKLLKRPNELPDNMLDDRTKYQAYFNNQFKQNIDSLNQMGSLIYPVYKTLLRIPHISAMFKTTRHRRFLMHLVGHHGKIGEKDSGVALVVGSPCPFRASIRYSPLMDTYFKHSCDSNIEFNLRDGKCYMYANKRIKKGEQLHILHAPSWVNSTAERKTFLLENFNIKCECSRCQGKVASPAQRQQLVSHSAFHLLQEFNSKNGQRLMDACVTILQQYGRMDWCDEMEYVQQCFHGLYGAGSVLDGLDFNHPLVRDLLQRLKF